MKAAIIVFPGTNREQDMGLALQAVTGHAPHMMWHKDSTLPNCDLIVLPGGFSYGDYLRCGAMAAHSPIMRDVIARAKSGTRLLAVCNGFQMLVETGLVPGALLRNASLHFICKQVHLRVESNASPFTSSFKAGDVIHVPVAHGEGNYFADADTIKRMEDKDQIAFRYCNENGVVDESANPNGSQSNIAGVFNDTKTILGMMPHPEDSVTMPAKKYDGRKIFESLVGSLS